MAVSFDRSRFQLLRDFFAERWILRESHSEQTVVLAPGTWSLLFDAGGKAYLAEEGSEETQWCADLLTVSVAQHPQNPEKIYVKAEGGQLQFSGSTRRGTSRCTSPCARQDEARRWRCRRTF